MVFKSMIERIRQAELDDEARNKANDKILQNTKASREMVSITTKKRFDPKRLLELLRDQKVTRIKQTKSIS
jgi:hypothetical protein